MDAAEYFPMFVAECREHLQELNLALIRLEEHPEDSETIGEIFRIAHSLKGMSATMGFERMAALTHAMEDVFEVLRDTQARIDHAAIDVVLACLDALAGAVDALDSDGVEALDPEPLIGRLHSLVGSGGTGSGGGPGSAAHLALAEPLGPHDGSRLVRVSVEVADEAAMPSVRIFMVLDALARLGRVLRSVPAEHELDRYGGRTVELVLATPATDEVVAQAIERVGEIATVGIAAVADAPSGTEGDLRDDGADETRTPGRGRKTSTTVRVDAERLDQLMHLMGELVVARTRLEAIAGGSAVPGLSHAVQDLARSSHALQAMVMQVRMIPVEAVLQRLPRLVRDISAKLGKKVELMLTGQETELDRSVVEALGDPLVHLVRNALDHGLETPEERIAAGKPETGRLEISARHAGGSVLISVRDDGRGVNPVKVAAIAVERGAISPDAAGSVDMQRALELILAPGFSTADQTTDLSGRGVGMDVVSSMVRGLGGDVTISSEPGTGTAAQLRLPLTLAIISALLVEARDIPFALPLERVERTLQLSDQVVRSVARQRMLVLRDTSIPLVDLADALGYGPGQRRTHAVIVSGLDRQVALEVDALVGQRELVTRPLPDEVGRGCPFSGGAVLSNGEIALVVDCDALANAACRPVRLQAA